MMTQHRGPGATSWPWWTRRPTCSCAPPLTLRFDRRDPKVCLHFCMFAPVRCWFNVSSLQIEPLRTRASPRRRAHLRTRGIGLGTSRRDHFLLSLSYIYIYIYIYTYDIQFIYISLSIYIYIYTYICVYIYHGPANTGRTEKQTCLRDSHRA